MTTATPPRPCPACSSAQVRVFFQNRDVPASSTLLMRSRREALDCPRGDIVLGVCEDCGFIANHAFDESLTEYSERYEETQSYSPTFRAYHQELARDLIERLGLRGKNLLEIGCGKGEFLALLCGMADATGVGFDPSFREDRDPSPDPERVTYRAERFSEQHAQMEADLYCCIMTLEHIPAVSDFIGMLRRAMANCPDAVLFIQVPEVERILSEGRFCDILYEHCSYFLDGSLRGLLMRSGFEILSSRVLYEGQHLTLEARPTAEATQWTPTALGIQLAENFSKRCAEQVSSWEATLTAAIEREQRVVLWGSGSKATAFLNTIEASKAIEYVVDINPHRQSMFMAGTGQTIVAPGRLPEIAPDSVVIMNPIYRSEIERSLTELGLRPELHTV